MDIAYPVLLAFRNGPVGVIEGLSVSRKLVFHDTADAIMFVEFGDFVVHVASKQRQTRNITDTVAREMTAVFSDDDEKTKSMHVRDFLEVAYAYPHCMELPGLVSQYTFQPYRGSMQYPMPIRPSEPVILPEPMLPVDGFLHTIQFDSDDDTVIISETDMEEEVPATEPTFLSITPPRTPSAQEPRRGVRECCICCEEIPNVHDRFMPTCRDPNHTMCQGCVVRHATNWTNHSISAHNPNAVLCPHEGCEGQFSFGLLQRLLPERDMERLYELKTRFSRCGYVECPNVDCCTPTMHYSKISPTEFVWVMQFKFLMTPIKPEDVVVTGREKPVSVKPHAVSEENCVGFKVTFATPDTPHRVTLRKCGTNVPMERLKQPEGQVAVTCDRCGYIYCYHCLAQRETTNARAWPCKCAECVVPMAGQINRWFVRPECMVDKEGRQAPLMRNYELTSALCYDQLNEMSQGDTLSVKCSCCRTPMHKSTACNELTHCGLRKCFVCGLSSLEGEKNLIDHYGHDRCPLYDADGWRHMTRGMPRCVEGECHDEHRDCTCPEHAAYRATVVYGRRCHMLVAALRTLPPGLLHQVVRLIFMRGGPLLSLYEDVVQNSLYHEEWVRQ